LKDTVKSMAVLEDKVSNLTEKLNQEVAKNEANEKVFKEPLERVQKLWKIARQSY